MITLERIKIYLERFKELKREIDVYGNHQIFYPYNVSAQRCKELVENEENPDAAFRELLNMCEILDGIIKQLNESIIDDTDYSLDEHADSSFQYKPYNDLVKRIYVLFKDIKNEDSVQ